MNKNEELDIANAAKKILYNYNHNDDVLLKGFLISVSYSANYQSDSLSFYNSNQPSVEITLKLDRVDYNQMERLKEIMTEAMNGKHSVVSLVREN